MKIAVCVKHAIDETELRVDASGSPILEGAPTKMSTFDKNAVEEAIRLKTSGGGDVTIFMVGPMDARKSMKEALAMGADKGVLVIIDSSKLDSTAVSGLLAGAISKAGPFDVVICAEGSSDIYSGQVPPMLSELLDLPYVGYALKLEIANGTARIERSLEDSVEVVESPVPFVVSVVSEINEPRYPTLIQIMQASKKPVGESLAEFGEPAPWSVRVLSITAQTMNRKKVIIEGTPEAAAAKLIDALAKEGLIPR